MGSPARLRDAVEDRSGHRIGDVAQHGGDLAADLAHRGDGGDGDQRGDQRVFDGGGAVVVLHQLAENGQHLNPRINCLFEKCTRLERDGVYLRPRFVSCPERRSGVPTSRQSEKAESLRNMKPEDTPETML